MNSKDLIDFEESIAEAFNRGEIRAPVHLTSGNEEALIEYFGKYVNPGDWVCTTWRSHYHCLLKGVPPEELRAAIMAGRSISLCFPKYRIVSSAIAGGILPIAVGIAMGIKRKKVWKHVYPLEPMQEGKPHHNYGLGHMENIGSDERVHCFVGDMMGQSGMAYECIRYSGLNNFSSPYTHQFVPRQLPINFILEDNGLSVCTDTSSIWGKSAQTLVGYKFSYQYKSKWPHAGAGKRIQF